MTNMNFDDSLVLIPARMASTRLPGKPLADICGAPMIVQVVRRAVEANVGRVVAAVDDQAVFDVIVAAGFEAVMTRMDHQSGSDRIFEALQKCDPKGKARYIINVQGDLPTIEPETVRASLRPLEDEAVDIATLTVEIEDEEEKTNPDVVKIIGSPVSDTPPQGALFYPRDRAVGRGAALSSYRPLCLSPRIAGAVRVAQALDTGTARTAGAIARAGSRHAH